MSQSKPDPTTRLTNLIGGILIALIPMLLAVFLVTQFADEEECDENCQEATQIVGTNYAIPATISASETALVILETNAPTLTREAQTAAAFSNTQSAIQPATQEAQIATQAEGAANSNQTATSVAETTTPTSEPCAFVFNTVLLPELNTEIERLLAAADLENVFVSASAYGEDCVGQQSNTVQYFAAMQTDFVITMNAEDIQGQAAIGDQLAPVLDILLDLPADQISGSNPGMLTITVQGENEERLTINSDMAKARTAREEDQTGENLIAALSDE